MRSRKAVLGAVLGLLSLPVALAVVEAASFHARNRSNGSLVSSGERREYLLYVPESYDPTRPTPLVISMHGAGVWGATQRDISLWNDVADQNGFLVVYPSGIRGGGPRIWNVDRGAGRARDVRFIAELIDTLMAAYNIDPTQVYADGLSNGGGMAFVLSCTMSDRIAAVGLVASAQTLPWGWCTDDRPVPMIAFHGTEDRTTPYDGGPSWVSRVAFPAIPRWAARWAGRNGCAPEPADSAVAADVVRRSYTDCVGGASVVLYTIQGGGHTWPGGGPLPEWMVGPTSHSVDATRVMWSFFREHRLLTTSVSRGR
ncbi:MAG: PHB depolymerase family esterase [Longimicrobiales bacterium]|nr:PHB depolymerase family esterase [Longimicrobiales bacterium]